MDGWMDGGALVDYVVLLEGVGEPNGNLVRI